MVGRVLSPHRRGRLLLHLNPLNALGWRLLGPVAAVHRRVVAGSTHVTAVVGSMGKTTTARAATAALGLAEPRRIEANYLTQVALALLRVRSGQRQAVVEVGIHGPGEMARYATAVRPDTTVVTWIGSEHHTSLGTLDVTRREKARMVEALPAGGLAVLNADDPRVLWMAGRTRAPVVTYGLSRRADVRAEDVRLDWPRGIRFRLRTDGRVRDVRTRLIGRHMVHPVLAAVAVATAEGVELDEALGRLEHMAPTWARLEPIRLPGGAVLLQDDWKGARESYVAALETLAEVPARRRLVVMGQVPELQRKRGTTYQRLGELAGRAASRVVFVGCTEDFRSLRIGARRGGLPDEAIVHARRRAVAAIDAVPTDLGPGDVVLVKGGQSQRLERVSLALQGRTVACDRQRCRARMLRCADCRRLGG